MKTTYVVALLLAIAACVTDLKSRRIPNALTFGGALAALIFHGFTGRSDGLLLLTATPHDGYDLHFASLIELLDPSLVDGRGGMAGNAYRRHVVRRLKSQIRDASTGAPMFPERRVIPVKVDTEGVLRAPVRRFHRALAELIAPRLQRLRAGRCDVTGSRPGISANSPHPARARRGISFGSSPGKRRWPGCRRRPIRLPLLWLG